ncbi:MAG: 4-hydroxy-tetrahydrodipicolinate synthase [Planctomycetes bacterium]|nr:4-hydroxy-tetrahydrodipicolinate synthase [Planctomycetota bacterium]
MLEGVFTALVTPFRDGGVDWKALGELIEAQINEGIHGLVPCGTTGESPTLTPEEHEQVVAFAVERTNGRVPVLAGTGSNSTAEAVRYTRHARAAGADAALIVLPYYNRPTPEGIIEHFKALAAEGLPLVIYNIPARTGVNLTVESYRSLAEIPGVVATKEASGSLTLVESILADGKLKVFSGDDALALPLMCLGAHGVISVASNVAPRAMVDLYDYIAEGKLVRARERHRRLTPLFHALFVETNPVPVKAALAALGRIEEIVRLPLVPLRDASRQVLERALEECGEFLLE